jgi:AmmeMemoRadiSam system protein A
MARKHKIITFLTLSIAVIMFTTVACNQNKEKNMTAGINHKWSPELSQGEEQTLFAIASDTLQWCINTPPNEFDFGKYTISEKLKTPRATFVTLNLNGMLRGCIGSLEPHAPLYKSVHDNAINAALRDPRFPAVTPAELPQLDIHISVLSPIKPIKSLDEFRLGEHGIILEKGYHSAVFLPEVATEQGWNVAETLTHLSQKAGLAPDAWKSNTSFKIFSSISIGSPRGQGYTGAAPHSK